MKFQMLGSADKPGPVRLSDVYNSQVGDASMGIAASQKALYDAYSSLNSRIGGIKYSQVGTNHNGMIMKFDYQGNEYSIQFHVDRGDTCMSLYKTGDPYALIWRADGANVPMNSRINIDSAFGDCNNPTATIGSYNSSTLNTPYKTGQTPSAAGLVFSQKRGANMNWNKQLAFTDGAGEFYWRNTQDTGTWTDWQRLVPRFQIKSYSASVTTAANSGGHAEYNISVTGYVPIAIHTATTNHGSVVLQHVSISGSKGHIYARNVTSGSITSTWSLYILYITTGFGVS